jgi:recombination protein RecR
MLLPAPIQILIDSLSRLPGVGPKTASRLTFFLLRDEGNLAEELAEAIGAVRTGTTYCQTCFNITEAGRLECQICSSPERDGRVLCIVEDPLDVVALERTQGFQGRYHVLHGALSPVEGIGPEDLKIRELITRLREGEVKEVILATNPSMTGDATAMYLRDKLLPLNLQVTRLARGLPMGGDLEYADQSTLLRAIAGRQKME